MRHFEPVDRQKIQGRRIPANQGQPGGHFYERHERRGAMSLARLRTHFAQWREWELNPIVVKELRQAVRSWGITGLLLLFLIVLFITSVVFLLTQSFEVNDNQQLGGMLFPAFLIILAAASVLFIPLYLGLRVAGERQESNRDLLYAS